MIESLDELVGRLRWARGEIQTLEAEIVAWTRENFTLSGGPHPLPGFLAVMVDAKGPVTLGIRARGGVIANEIRSCLDGLATVLAERNHCSGAYFPIARNEFLFEKDKLLRKRLTKFRPVDRDAMLAFRPFETGNDGAPGNLILYGMHHADVRRKHNKLGVKSTGGSIAILDGDIDELSAEELMRIKTPGRTMVARLSSRSRVRLAFVPEVDYDEPEVLRGRGLVETLYEYSEIVERVITSFR